MTMGGSDESSELYFIRDSGENRGINVSSGLPMPTSVWVGRSSDASGFRMVGEKKVFSSRDSGEFTVVPLRRSQWQPQSQTTKRSPPTCRVGVPATWVMTDVRWTGRVYTNITAVRLGDAVVTWLRRFLHRQHPDVDNTLRQCGAYDDPLQFRTLMMISDASLILGHHLVLSLSPNRNVRSGDHSKPA